MAGAGGQRQPMTDKLVLFTPAGVLKAVAPLTLAARRLKALGFDVQIDEAAPRPPSALRR